MDTCVKIEIFKAYGGGLNDTCRDGCWCRLPVLPGNYTHQKENLNNSL